MTIDRSPKRAVFARVARVYEDTHYRGEKWFVQRWNGKKQERLGTFPSRFAAQRYANKINEGLIVI